MYNIGVFDSGLGGLIITNALTISMPEYNFIYLGDTKHLPYGNKDIKLVNEYSRSCITALCEKFNCALIIIACNTASLATKNAFATEFKTLFPNRHLLSIIPPTINKVINGNYKSVGVIGTNTTINSKIYETELLALNPNLSVTSLSTPKLVNIIENNLDELAEKTIMEYLDEFKGDTIDALILGCTHYPFYKYLISSLLKQKFNKNIDVISQDEFIPDYIKNYIKNNPELNNNLQKDGIKNYYITEFHNQYKLQAINITGNKDIKIQLFDNANEKV